MKISQKANRDAASGVYNASNRSLIVLYMESGQVPCSFEELRKKGFDGISTVIHGDAVDIIMEFSSKKLGKFRKSNFTWHQRDLDMSVKRALQQDTTTG